MAALAVSFGLPFRETLDFLKKTKSHSIQITHMYNAFLVWMLLGFANFLLSLWDLWDQFPIILFDCDQWANVLCVCDAEMTLAVSIF